MFLFINSLESLLTVKAIDGLDPYKRESNANKDLSALGAGNALSGLLGGLPMISEVARSSANVNFGGRTRWANFFHGLFLLIAMLLFIPVIEMIPNSALAALLIAVGYRLASPKEFFKTYKIGAEQLVIFVITIVVTVSTDLLIGVGSGILVKFIFHILNGAPIKGLFKANYEFSENENEYAIAVKDAAIFSNLIGFKNMFKRIKPGKKVVINFADARIVDHSFMEQLHHFEEEYHHGGGSVSVIGFDHFQTMSNHPLAARKVAPVNQAKIEIKLSPRQMELRKFSESQDLTYYPQRVRSLLKFTGFPLQRSNKLLFEENILSTHLEQCKLEVSDISLQEGALQDKSEMQITLLQLSELEVSIPDFALEPEGLWSKLFEAVEGKDIDFEANQTFSKKYYLRGEDEVAIRQFFNQSIIHFLENREEMHVECHKNKLLFYKKRNLLEPSEIDYMIRFAKDFAKNIK
jgi:hypothetical protein